MFDRNQILNSFLFLAILLSSTLLFSIIIKFSNNSTKKLILWIEIGIIKIIS